jgi:NAD(P)H-hydrate epimerase
MAHSLTNNLYTGDQTRELDRRAIHEHGIPGAVLMKRAGRAAFEHACALWPDNTHWLVLCGGGNNAGDGYVFAALAAQRQHRVEILHISAPEQLTGDARAAFEYARQEGVPLQPFTAHTTPPAGDAILVDAILGIGLRTPVRDAAAEAIQWINSAGLPVLALDLPSGLCADTGSELGCAVHAAHTISFIAPKIGLFTGRGPALCGEIAVVGLGVPKEAFAGMSAAACRVTLAELVTLLPERAADAHKGQFGHVMVIGGDKGYGGAAILAAETAAMTGAGLVSLATREEHVTAALVRRPELMVIGVPSGQELEPHMARPNVLVVGPGLGRTPWSEQLLQQALLSESPLVLDADALNILAEGRLPLPAHQCWVMTPHPGEAARLLRCTTREVQSDRVAAARKLQATFGGVIVLKGAGTLIAGDRGVSLANVGNPGLATAGSGDVLAGLIGSLLAQGHMPLAAAQLGVCLHGEAADLAVEETGVAGLQAAELMPYIRELLKT